MDVVGELALLAEVDLTLATQGSWTEEPGFPNLPLPLRILSLCVRANILLASVRLRELSSIFS